MLATDVTRIIHPVDGRPVRCWSDTGAAQRPAPRSPSIRGPAKGSRSSGV